jgi:benzoyl-CoA-dihydrodiol lyase
MAATKAIDFQTGPANYRHWRIETDGPIARLVMQVDDGAGLVPGYELKLNSYDLGVDIELADAVQRLRFEHPQVKAVVLCSGRERVFCAGANIRMLAGSSHAHKVNFCKFTNETRGAIEDASAHSGQTWMAAVNGTAAGGGYELALATEWIVLTDDGTASVSLPEVPLLAVLPGTGGLTRLTDKRKVRRDRADVFCTVEEGIKGKRALDWRLVDEIVPQSRFAEAVTARARALAERSDRPDAGPGVRLDALERRFTDDGVRYRHVTVEIDRPGRVATVQIAAPGDAPPADASAALAQGSAFWPLELARELDDAILHLRLNERDTGVIVFKTHGDPARVVAYDEFLAAQAGDWFIREVLLYWKRVLKRIDMTARTLVALIEPGSAFAGTLAEIAFAADRAYMADGVFEGDNRPAAHIVLTSANFGPHPMANGLTRLQTRFLAEPDKPEALAARIGEPIAAREAEDIGLVTFAHDDIDWDDEVRIFLEERASFSADALTGLEANLRFAGPETMETKIFGRLTAWQNWIFQRPNAVGEDGALKRYGSGRRPDFNPERT